MEVCMKYKVGIITLSDKGSRGEREDKSGPAIREMLEGWGVDEGGEADGREAEGGEADERVDEGGVAEGSQAKYEIVSEVLLPDDQILLENVLIGMCDGEGLDLILTTGGTGFSQRDITPEATCAVATRNAPGIAEYMRAKSFEITPKAMLSRGASVIRNSTLIINLPGSPKAVRENLSFILPALDHGLDILLGRDGECGSEGRK
ncbi:MAG: MogA/MoaB family molybdenum cofactor biosynthesis protein [Firmicutes bacterium]|nr:MogA/MoaB family molybdenum cofactor biosynthesis protein [Bacillota bacterium]